MKLNKNVLKRILKKISATREVEIGCDDCFDKINQFAELELLGKSPENAMPLVKEHLDNCGDCREEYHALLKGLEELKVYS